jgi:hypothetical protein
MRGDMTKPESYLDAERMRSLRQQEAQLQAELDAAYARWESWS